MKSKFVTNSKDQEVNDRPSFEETDDTLTQKFSKQTDD